MSRAVSAAPPVRRSALWPLLLILLVGLLAVAGWSYLEQRREQLRLLEKQSAELAQRLAGGAPASASPGPSPGRGMEEVLHADSEALAAADLQSRLMAMIAAGGAELQTVQILDAGDLPPFRVIRLKTRFLGDHEALRKVLLALEGQALPLLPDALSVRARKDGAQLLVDLEVSALAKITGDEPQ